MIGSSRSTSSSRVRASPGLIRVRGNLGCLGEDHNGKIVGGRMDGIDLTDLRVAFPDALNCLYQGQLSATAGAGEYICFAGGMRIIEEGSWQLKRSGQ